MNTHELAWAAGYFDGEGSVGFYNGKGREGLNGSVRVVIGNTQLEELERFQTAVNGLGKITGPRHYVNRKSMWWWQAQNFESAQAVTAMLWKFLSSNKKNDFIIAWNQDREIRRERSARPFCKVGHNESNKFTIKGRPSCRTCMSNRLNK